MKMMHGACFLACSNMSRTREAPTPTNISTKSEPEIVKNGTFASPAMARASSVLPVPGEPTISTPLGILPPSFWNLPGSFRKSTISPTSCLASSTPARRSLHLAQQIDEHEQRNHHRSELDQQLGQDAGLFGRLTFDHDVGLDELTDQGGVAGLGVEGLEMSLVLQYSANGVALQHHAFHAAGFDIVVELRVRQGRCRIAVGYVAAEHRQHDQHDDDPEQDVFGQIIQLRVTLRGPVTASPRTDS